jgi:DNA helicase-2/ATP-dependent DNA helicase PcrA
VEPSLNPEQLEAVAHGEGPLLVLAGAGSGKTRVLTHRIARLVKDRVAAPREVLAVTFTNKAAGEMRERVQALLGGTVQMALHPVAMEGMWVSTFHAAGARLLRNHGEAIGLSRSFIVYDDSDQTALCKRVLKELNLDLDAPAVLSRIDGWKNKGWLPDAVQISEFDVPGKRALKVYRAYQDALRRANAVDFGDLIVRVEELLRRAPELLAKLRERFKWLLVDEFQDTNPAQYRLLRLLAHGERPNLCVVGDDDQSIYAWRGADVSNILDFEEDFPGCKVVKLERNYRSTQNILSSANAVISRNAHRHAKRLYTDGAAGEKVDVICCADDREEAQTVASLMAGLHGHGFAWSEIAGFYRTNAQSRSLEEALRARRIPYIIVRGRSFYDRMEVKDVLAYLRLLVNPASDTDLLRVINTPTRGIGATTVEKLQALARDKGVALWDALPMYGGKPAEFRVMMDEIRADAQTLGPAPVVELVARATGYLDALEEDERRENVMELASAAAESQTLDEFLEKSALVSDADTEVGKESVALMTLHAAKGLEFDAVFMTGMEMEFMPPLRALEDEDAMSEERRLCYVGMTRARKRLFCSWAERRLVFGQVRPRVRSPFLDDVPENLLRITGGPRRAPDPWSGRSSYGRATFQGQDRPGGFNAPATRRTARDDGFDQRTAWEDEETAGLRPGLRVRHVKFGLGVVKDVDGDKVTVDFPSGRRLIKASFVEPA